MKTETLNYDNLNDGLFIIQVNGLSFIYPQASDKFYLLKQKNDCNKMEKQLIIQEIKFKTHEAL